MYDDLFEKGKEVEDQHCDEEKKHEEGIKVQDHTAMNEIINRIAELAKLRDSVH